MKNLFLKQFFVYPLVSIFIWSYLYPGGQGLYFSNLAEGSIRQLEKLTFFDLSNTGYLYVFAYLFGYTYGTISSVLKVRSFPILLGLPLFFVKVIVVCIFSTNIGLLLLVIELILFLLFLFFKSPIYNKISRVKSLSKKDRTLLSKEIAKIMRLEKEKKNRKTNF